MGYRIELYKALPFVHAKQDTIDAWEAGKDFKIVNGPYCSKRDFNQLKKDFDIIELDIDEENEYIKDMACAELDALNWWEHLNGDANYG